MDQSKKTMRHFYCRDVLWETFEQMANDFDCSIDYLVNEAMRYYARSKNYQSPGGPQMTGGNPVEAPPRGPAANSQANAHPGNNKPPSRNAPATQQPPPSMGPGSSSPGPRRPAPPTPGYAAGRGNNVPVATGGPTGHMAQHQPQPQAPPAPMPQMGSAGPTLFLI